MPEQDSADRSVATLPRVLTTLVAVGGWYRLYRSGVVSRGVEAVWSRRFAGESAGSVQGSVIFVAASVVSPRPQQTDPITFLGAHDFVYLGEHLLLTGS